MSANSLCLPSTVGETRRERIEKQAPRLGLVVAAFAAVYLIWGSTFLGIHLAIQSMPPLLMGGARFLLAGGVLYGAMRIFAGAPRPEPIHWRSAAVVGALLLLAGNGAMSWSQQTVPSGIAALMIAATPLWMIVVEWLRPQGRRPGPAIFVGLALGFLGVALIVAGKNAAGQSIMNPVAAAVLLAAPMFWGIGSIYSRHAAQNSSALLNIAMQMLCGGVLMLAAGVALGETRGFHFGQITASSAWAFVYLTVMGSLVGFTAYAWLLGVSTPAKVSTYAFVNPLIAVFLGRVVLHEPLPRSLLLAGSLIIAAVVLLIGVKAKRGAGN